MSDSINILLIDDDVEDQLITRRLVQRAFGAAFTLDCLGSWDEAVEQIREQHHDVYLVDYSLGSRNGIELLREVGTGKTMAPIIMLTGSNNHSVDLAAQAAGAADYLVKAELTAPLLERAIRYAIERKRVERELIHLAHFDPLTGLLNRSQFRAELESSIRHGARTSESLAVLLLDLDHFKDVNDTLGHPVGDLLLREVGARLAAVVRDTDTVARLGGDEFVIIATHLHDSSDASTLAEKIVESLSEPVSVDGNELFVKTSIGITLCPYDSDDPDEVLRNADLALYKAKDEGRGQYCFYQDDLNTASQKRQAIESELRAGLEQQSFRLCYQPKIDVSSSRVVGVEALVRWLREDGSLALPDSFIPVAEASGLIVPLGEWILREACQQQCEWKRRGVATGPISVNLSAIQLRRDEFVRRLIQIIDDSGIEPADLELEITESTLMGADDGPLQRIKRLRDRGVRIAIDDFGTGYSSLSQLRRLPVDTLKIDRSFVHDIVTSTGDAAIVEAVIQLGASLGLKVVAEGVETAGQRDLLVQQRCEEAQGFYYSVALEPDALVRWIESFSQADSDHREESADDRHGNAEMTTSIRQVG